MKAGSTKGLLASAGKSIARLAAPRYEAAIGRLRGARGGRDVREVLDELDLASQPVMRAALDAASMGDGWDDARWQLIRAAQQQRDERMNPSS